MAYFYLYFKSSATRVKYVQYANVLQWRTEHIKLLVKIILITKHFSYFQSKRARTCNNVKLKWMFCSCISILSFSTQLTSSYTAVAKALIQPPPPLALPLPGSLPGEECIVGFAGNQCMIPAITFRTMASDILPMLCCKSYWFETWTHGEFLYSLIMVTSSI